MWLRTFKININTDAPSDVTSDLTARTACLHVGIWKPPMVVVGREVLVL